MYKFYQYVVFYHISKIYNIILQNLQLLILTSKLFIVIY